MRIAMIALLLSACAPAEPPPPPSEGTVELGLMSDGFVALEDGVELTLIPGSQGGFHVAIAVRVFGFDPNAMLEVERNTRRDDTGDLVTTTTFRSTFDEAGILTRDVPVFLCPAPVGISIADAPLDLSAAVTSAEMSGHASLAFVPRCPIGEQAAFCDRICRR